MACTTLLFGVLFGFLWIKGDYTTILLQKIGFVSASTEDERSDYWTVESWKTCLEQLDIDADVVFFGDSITRSGDFQAAFPDVTIVNLGISGDSLDGMIKRIDMIDVVSPEKIFIEGGINGLSGYPVSETIEMYRKLLIEMSDAYPNAEIYVQGILPVREELNDNSNARIAEADEQIKELCEELGVVYIDLYNLLINEDEQLPEEFTVDGIHLSETAYEIWYEYIREYVEE